jgi:hypothetical protein
MAFSFPQASISILKGNDFYRIKAQAVDTISSPLTALGPGDLIPVNVGFSAIAVGPESDYEKYELLYRDETAPGGIQRMPFSKDAPFIGNITADNAQEYPNGNKEKAIVFIRIADIGTLESSNTGGGAVARIGEALADLKVYTNKNPVQVATKRYPNKRSSNVILKAAKNSAFYIPGYGRRIFTTECAKMLEGLANVTATVFGIRLYNPLVSSTLPALLELSGRTAVQKTVTELLPATAVAGVNGNFPLVFSYNADVDGKGYFDFYEVLLDSDTDINPSDYDRGRGFHLTMEVRD